MGKADRPIEGSTCWRDHDVVWYAADRGEARAALIERAKFLELRQAEGQLRVGTVWAANDIR